MEKYQSQYAGANIDKGVGLALKRSDLNQAEYDALVSAGTVDGKTMYFIYSDAAKTLCTHMYLGGTLIGPMDLSSALQFSKLSQAEYDAISSKSDSTIYLIYSDAAKTILAKIYQGAKLIYPNDLSDTPAVKYTSQSLTTAQQTQARTNIGAGSATDVSAKLIKSETYIDDEGVTYDALMSIINGAEYVNVTDEVGDALKTALANYRFVIVKAGDWEESYNTIPIHKTLEDLGSGEWDYDYFEASHNGQRFSITDDGVAEGYNIYNQGVYETVSDVDTKLEDYAKQTGEYDELISGSSKNLIGHNDVLALFNRRTSGGTSDIGTGTAVIKQMRGNAVVWNQLMKNGNFADGTNHYFLAGCTLTIANNIATITKDDHIIIRSNTITTVAGHKYLTKLRYYNSKSSAQNVQMECGGAHQEVQCPSGWSDIALLFTASSASYFGIYAYQGQTGDKTAYWNVLDLTLMFGAGNEPSTVAEFKALFPRDYYAYNAGAVLGSKATQLLTNGFNQYNPTTGKFYALALQYQITGTYTAITQDGNAITPDSNGKFTPSVGEVTVTGGDSTTCVHLVHSGARDGDYEPYESYSKTLNLATLKGKVNGTGSSVVIFADGMIGNGTVYDTLDRVDSQLTKATKRWGKVDLGSLTWAYSDGEFYAIIGVKSQSANVICHLYPNYKYSSPAPTDMYYAADDQGAIYLKNSAYSDPTAFKTAMSGVYLYYELATPLSYTLDSPIDCNYPVNDYGMEWMLPENGSTPTTAPIAYDVTYSINAIDTVRNIDTNHPNATSIGNLLAALKSAGVIADYTMTYNSSTGAYAFTITANS